MQADVFIDTLLAAHGIRPGFPFDDWNVNPDSLGALVNLWDALFQAAAAPLSATYTSHGDARVDRYRPLLDTSNPDMSRRVTATYTTDGGIFFIAVKLATDDQLPLRLDLGDRPDRSELAFATDLDRNRLIAAFEMIRIYTHADLPTLDAAEALEKQFVETYKQHFGFPDFDPFAGPTPDDDADEISPQPPAKE